MRGSDNDVFTRMKAVSLKIEELKDRDIQTEKICISKKDTISMKKIIILDGIFSQYISKIGRAKIRR